MHFLQSLSITAVFSAVSVLGADYYPPVLKPSGETIHHGEVFTFSWNQTIPAGVASADVVQEAQPMLGYLSTNAYPYWLYPLLDVNGQRLAKIPLYGGSNSISVKIVDAATLPGYVIGWGTAGFPDHEVYSPQFTVAA